MLTPIMIISSRIPSVLLILEKSYLHTFRKSNYLSLQRKGDCIKVELTYLKNLYIVMIGISIFLILTRKH